ncbi:MAG: hypothetical protein HC764_23395, partial [Pleurocapsa sp. CRU_1_2]|nr:hypothetical protein [Pleurocapsa sp. CRU_1_2]
KTRWHRRQGCFFHYGNLNYYSSINITLSGFWLILFTFLRKSRYWIRQLEGAPTQLNLPIDRPRPLKQTTNGAHLFFQFPSNMLESLRALCRREGVTLFMTLLGAFKTLLCRYTNQEDILVVSPIANRNCSEIQGLIGSFSNDLILRTDLSGNPTFRDLLNRVREVTLEAYAHQEVPVAMVLDKLQIQQNSSYPPLAQVMFSLQNFPMLPPVLPDIQSKLIPVDTGLVKLDWNMIMTEENNGLTGLFGYNTDLFDKETITRVLEDFQDLLESFVANPNCRVWSD